MEGGKMKGEKKRKGMMVFFLSFILAISMGGDKLFAATLNVSLEMGGETLSEIPPDNPLTPDDDGSNDFVTLNITSSSEEEVRIIVDTNGDGDYVPITDWSSVNWEDSTDPNYAGKFDYTMQGHVFPEGSLKLDWQGRDNTWRVVTNGTYKCKVEFDGNGDGDYTDAEPIIVSIAVKTAGVSGKVTTPEGKGLAGVKVEAGSPYGWGWTFTDDNGNFTIAGLKPGTYHLEARKQGYVTVWKDNVSVTEGEVTSEQNFKLKTAKQITGTITIQDGEGNPVKFQSFTDRWGEEIDKLGVHIEVWNPTGPGGGWNEADIAAGESSTDYSVSVEPGNYSLRAEAEGYASEIIKGITVEPNGTVKKDGEIVSSIDIVLTKANRIYGKVVLPQPATTDTWINVSARSSTSESWGGGQIKAGSQEGNFEIRSVLPGIYTVRIEVPEFAASTKEVEVVAGQDIDLGEVEISSGRKITGEITIEGGAQQAVNLWINCWSPTGEGQGTEVSFEEEGQTTQDYTISGLSEGTYYLETWLNGYEMEKRPLRVEVSDKDVTQNITLSPFKGKIRGTVRGDNIDYSKVLVIVDQPEWGDWAHKTTIVDDSGNFTISGLGTGFYVVRANQYKAYRQTESGREEVSLEDYVNGEEGIEIVPDGTFGTAIESVSVVNDPNNPARVTLTLQKGATISGTVKLDSTLVNNGWKPSDLQGKEVKAYPMKMQMMEMMSQYYPGMITIDGQGNCVYEIKGLEPGTYIVEPPLRKSESSPSYGEPENDVAYTAKVVTVQAGETKTGVDFTLSNGFSISGTITIPESAKPQDDREWIGELKLDNMTDPFAGMGVHKSVQGFHFTKDGVPSEPPNPPHSTEDFTTTYSYSLNHVPTGRYILHFWSDKFISTSKEIEITDANVSNVNLSLKKGANIVGKLVNADTGEPVTSADRVVVRCEARPWVEGSWRQTRDDEWSSSYIEDGTSKVRGNGNGDPNNVPGRFHLKSLPAGNYIVTVAGDWGERTDGSKNYASTTIAGIKISEDNVANGDEIDVGTIKLKEGVTLTGRVWEEKGGEATGYDEGIDKPLANIPVEAEPADRREGELILEAWTRGDGTYTIYGVNPEITWWEVTAAVRPFWHERFMKRVPYGEKSKLVNVSVATNRENINFQLTKATATITGIISKEKSDPDNKIPFSLPPFEEGAVEGGKTKQIPAVFILVQKEGEVYDDPMDGYEEISEFSEGNTTTFTIRDLEPGKYILRIYCPGFDTLVVKADAREKNLVDGVLNLGTLELQKGGSVSGTVRNADGTKPSLNDIQMVVAVKEDMSSMVFGKLIYNSSTREISQYEVKGLVPNTIYRLIFVGNEGRDIIIMPDNSTKWEVVDADTPKYKYNAVLSARKPSFLLISQKDDNGNFNLRILSSEVLDDTDTPQREDDVAEGKNLDLLTLVKGEGVLRGNILSADETGNTIYYELSPDRKEIKAFYEPKQGEEEFTFKIVGHRAAKTGETDTDTKGEASFTIKIASNYVSTDEINAINGGATSLGSFGDSTQVYFPAGSIEDTNDDGKAKVKITAMVASSAQPAPAFNEIGKAVFAPAAYPHNFAPTLPAGAVSEMYDISLPEGDTITTEGYANVGLEYDSSSGDVTKMNIFSYDSTTGYWRKESLERTIDESKHLITAKVQRLNNYFTVINSNPVVPSKLVATAGDGQITLTWEKGTAESGMVDTTTGYNVYRSTTSGTGYKKINPTILPASQTTYTDTGLTNGVTYYYVVRGVHGTSTEESEPSEEAEGTPQGSTTTTPSSDKKDKWYDCAIATASYGSPDAEEVNVLRKFRDHYLLKSKMGREVVKLYYTYSPAIADYIRDKEELRKAVRTILKPLVWLVKRKLAQEKMKE